MISRLSILLLLCLALSTSIFSAGKVKEGLDRTGEKYASGSKPTKELTLYSSRKEHLIKPLIEAYTKLTGIKINLHTAKAPPLIRSLEEEGVNTKADLFITVDAGNLWLAGEKSLLEKIDSPILKKNIPDHLRDPNDTWFGLSVRARTLVYSTERVKEADLSTYEALADKKWKERLVLRTSKKVYNQSLIAMFIAEHGEKKTSEIVKGWVSNLATTIQSNDTNVIKSIIAGKGDVGIVNTYYFGRLIKEDKNLPIKLFWPNQKEAGVHVNVSGGGVVKHSKNKKEAQKFLEWLSSDKAQNLFADLNMEYPANAAIKPSAIVSSWGKFKANQINVSSAGKLQADSVRLMKKCGYK